MALGSASCDDYTRECLVLVADISMFGTRVARELTSLIGMRGEPYTAVRDNGAELTSSAILQWRRRGGSSGTTSRRASRCKAASLTSSMVACATNDSTKRDHSLVTARGALHLLFCSGLTCLDKRPRRAAPDGSLIGGLARPQIIQIVAPPLRPLDPLIPVLAPVIGSADHIAVAVCQSTFDGVGVPKPAFVQQGRGC